jgi:hypothetical protein
VKFLPVQKLLCAVYLCHVRQTFLNLANFGAPTVAKCCLGSQPEEKSAPRLVRFGKNFFETLRSIATSRCLSPSPFQLKQPNLAKPDEFLLI